MSKLNQAGLGVYNNYGTRTTAEAQVGDVNVGGFLHEQTYEFRGDDNAATLTGTLVKGATVKEVLVNVTEAFVGVTAVDIGKKGSEAVDGFSIPVTVEGASVISAQGSLATTLTEDVKLAAKVTGTPDGVGRATVVVRYSALNGSKPV